MRLAIGRLEFKSGRLFENKKREEVLGELGKQLSAFANSEGGELVLGIREEGKAPRCAVEIDGVRETDPLLENWESFQRALDDTLRPYLPGIRSKRVPLQSRAGHVVVVVYVPAGNTAYQCARDLLYYGRSEFDAKALPDHEIRLRMSRGQVAQVQVRARVTEVITAEEDYRRRTEELADLKQEVAVRIVPAERRAKLNAPRRDWTEKTLRLSLRNSGPKTITDFAVEFQFERDGGSASPDGAELAASKPIRRRFREAEYRTTGLVRPTPKLFPEDEEDLGELTFHVPGPTHLRWTVFLDDSPPSRGTFELASLEPDRSATLPAD